MCICGPSQTLHSERFSAELGQARVWAEKRAWESEKNVHPLWLWRVYCHMLKDRKRKASQTLSMEERRPHSVRQPRGPISAALQNLCRMNIQSLKTKTKNSFCSFSWPLHFSHLYFSMVWSRNIFPNYLNKEISITSWVNILQPGTCVSSLRQTLIISLVDGMRYVAKKT